MELLQEAVPQLQQLATMGDSRTVLLEMGEAQAGARALGINVSTLDIQRAEDIGSAFQAVPAGTDALYVCATPLVNTNRVQINASALAAKLPTMHGFREAVDAGALISYGPNFPDLFRRAAGFVDKILRGASPGSIPIEQPTKFDLVINLKTALTLDLSLPASLLTQADEVIE